MIRMNAIIIYNSIWKPTFEFCPWILWTLIQIQFLLVNFYSNIFIFTQHLQEYSITDWIKVRHNYGLHFFMCQICTICFSHRHFPPLIIIVNIACSEYGSLGHGRRNTNWSWHIHLLRSCSTGQLGPNQRRNKDWMKLFRLQKGSPLILLGEKWPKRTQLICLNHNAKNYAKVSSSGFDFGRLLDLFLSSSINSTLRLLAYLSCP
jgi:hypothetical protein